MIMLCTICVALLLRCYGSGLFAANLSYEAGACVCVCVCDRDIENAVLSVLKGVHSNV